MKRETALPTPLAKNSSKPVKAETISNIVDKIERLESEIKSVYNNSPARTARSPQGRYLSNLREREAPKRIADLVEQQSALNQIVDEFVLKVN